MTGSDDDRGDAESNEGAAGGLGGEREPTVSRRRALGILGVGALSLGAGCSSLVAEETETRASTPTETPTDYPTPTASATPSPTATATESPTPTETATDSPTPTEEPGAYHPDARHVGVTTVDPERVQYNPTNPRNSPRVSHHLLFEPLAQYNYADRAFRPAAVTDWAVTDGAFEMTLREGLTWTNGDPVTATDLATQLRIAKHEGATMWEWADGLRTPDDRTVVLEMGADRNPALVERDVFAERFLQQDRATYGPYLDRLENGGSIDELRGFPDRDPVTCGPFRLVDRDVQRLSLERFDAHPDAHRIDFGEYEFRRLGASTSRQRALLDLQVDSDFSLFVDRKVAAALPDAVREVQTPSVFGMGLTPNHDHDHAGDRAVRRAVAHVVDRQAVLDAGRPRYKVTPAIPTGLATDVQAAWLGDELATYQGYGVAESRRDAAEQELRDAGYERDGDTWVDADGETVSLPVTVPSGWSDWSREVETVVSQLDDFGFDATVERTGNYFLVLDNGEFTLLAHTWLAGGPTLYPEPSLRHQLVEPQLHAAHSSYPAFDPQYGGSNASITVPARQGSGETTVDPGSRIDDLASGDDESEVREAVRELAWVANQDLPQIPLTEQYTQQWLTADEWDLPENVAADPDAQVAYAPTWLPRLGKLSYSG